MRATGQRGRTYGGEVAQTTYFSSSGGRTESGFLGAPRRPLPASVSDPYDHLSPLHRWTLRFTQAEMDAALGGYVKGGLRRIVVTKRGDSPRIDRARLIGTGGRSTIRGDTLAAALGLYDRWAFFRKARRASRARALARPAGGVRRARPTGAIDVRARSGSRGVGTVRRVRRRGRP